MRPTRTILAKRMSTCVIRGPYSCAGFSRFTVVVPLDSPLAGRRPSACCTTRLGTGALALREVPLDADAEPAPSAACGTERQFALTSTSIFGTVYATSPRACVIHGSTTLQAEIGWFT